MGGFSLPIPKEIIEAMNGMAEMQGDIAALRALLEQLVEIQKAHNELEKTRWIT